MRYRLGSADRAQLVQMLDGVPRACSDRLRRSRAVKFVKREVTVTPTGASAADLYALTWRGVERARAILCNMLRAGACTTYVHDEWLRTCGILSGPGACEIVDAYRADLRASTPPEYMLAARTRRYRAHFGSWLACYLPNVRQDPLVLGRAGLHWLSVIGDVFVTVHKASRLAARLG